MGAVEELWAGIGGKLAVAPPVHQALEPRGQLPSSFPVEAFGGGALTAVGLAIAELTGAQSVAVDHSLVADALRSEQALRIDGQATTTLWDPLSKIYHASDGWVRLHGNYSQHRAAIEHAFGTDDPEAVAARIAVRPAVEIEALVHDAGGAAAAAHALWDWREHPQGLAVDGEPLVATTLRDDATGAPWQRAAPLTTGRPGGHLADTHPWAGGQAGQAPGEVELRPLADLRVLELTRVIAGPVAGRTLSWFGADVLRVESPAHDELLTLTVDTGPGKRSTTLDLKDPADLDHFKELLTCADVLLHGLRPGALERLGLGAKERAEISPGLIDASLSAYGPTGPWAGRRGFDSLMQLSTGLALAEAQAAGADGPRALPCQVLDHGTGLLLAAAIIRAVTARTHDGHGRSVVGSLARTASALRDLNRRPFAGSNPRPANPGSLLLTGPHGISAHVPFPVSVEGVAGGWTTAPPLPGGDEARWL
jgi:hypothetical protein